MAHLKAAAAQIFVALMQCQLLQKSQHSGDHTSAVQLPFGLSCLAFQDMAKCGNVLRVEHLLAEYSRQLAPHQVCHPLNFRLSRNAVSLGIGHQ